MRNLNLGGSLGLEKLISGFFPGGMYMLAHLKKVVTAGSLWMAKASRGERFGGAVCAPRGGGGGGGLLRDPGFWEPRGSASNEAKAPDQVFWPWDSYMILWKLGDVLS